MNKIQYMHYRKYNDDIWNTISSLGGATVAILPIEENNTAIIAIARCSSTEVFNKKIGRDISAGRIRAYLNGRNELAGTTLKIITVTDFLKLKEIVAHEVQDEMLLHHLY